MDAVQVGDTFSKLKQQGMPEHLAVIHAITYALTSAQTHNDKRYVLCDDLPTLIEKEVQRVLTRWAKWVIAPIAGIAGFIWGIIKNWDSIKPILGKLFSN